MRIELVIHNEDTDDVPPNIVWKQSIVPVAGDRICFEMDGKYLMGEVRYRVFHPKENKVCLSVSCREA